MIDRRGSIRLAIAGAMATMLAGRASAQQMGSGGLIAPPAEPMTYCRKVERDMSGGHVFRVTRRFDVTFSPISEGYAIVGRQTGVEVEAPDALARFAELEEARDESGQFPIGLNAFGQIRTANAAHMGSDEVQAAVAQALEALSQLPVADSEHEQARRFVAALHTAGQGIIAAMPHDLFAPAGPPRRTDQLIALPDGGAGRVETLFEGDLDTQTGLMSAARREIVTSVEDSTRTTREEWSLTPA